MKVLTNKQAIDRLKTWTAGYVSQAAAARAAKVTPSQLANALADKAPIPPNLLRKIRVYRRPLYVTGEHSEYMQGCLNLEL